MIIPPTQPSDAGKGGSTASESLPLCPLSRDHTTTARAHMVPFRFFILFPRAYKISADTPLFPKSPIKRGKSINQAWNRRMAQHHLPRAVSSHPARDQRHSSQAADLPRRRSTRHLRLTSGGLRTLGCRVFFYSNLLCSGESVWSTLYVRTPCHSKIIVSRLSFHPVVASTQLAEGCCLLMGKRRRPLTIHSGYLNPASSIPFSTCPASPLLNPTLPRRRWHQQRIDGTKNPYLV